MTSKALGIVLSVLAGLQFMAGSAALTELLPGKVAAWFVLGVGAVQAGAGFYTGRAATLPADRSR